MDLARPSGVVLDGAFGFDLLTDELAGRFSTSEVYLRSVSPRDPALVYYTPEYAQISNDHKSPLEGFDWQRSVLEESLKSISESTRYLWYLPSMPKDPSQIRLLIRHPTVSRGRKHPTLWSTVNHFKVEYALDAGRPYVIAPYGDIATYLVNQGVKPNWVVQVEFSYPKA